MARRIKYETSSSFSIILQTMFEDGTTSEREFKIGDAVENLRYVNNGEIVTVSGRVIDIAYQMASQLSFSSKNPSDTIAQDMTIKSITLDASTQYNSNIVTVDMSEILEDEGMENVKRIAFFPKIYFNIALYYSDRTVQRCDVAIGDTFNNVRILDPKNVGENGDITGTFEVIAFGYKTVKNALTITSVVFKNDERTIIAEFDNILSMNEIYTYTLSDVEAFNEVLDQLADGDTAVLSGDIDATAQTLAIDGKNVTIDLAGQKLQSASSNSSGLVITNGTLTIEDSSTDGSGTLITEQDYDSTHGAGIMTVGNGGKVIINNATISAVRPDAVNKGQFGVCYKDNGSVEINGGTITAGWYALSGNGARTNADSKVVVNGGEITSTVDFAIYHPHPGTLEINGGTITGGAGAISINNGKVYIHGGTLSSLGTGDTGTWSDGTSGQQPSTINVNCRYGDCVLEIDGGTFLSANNVPIIVAGTAHTAAVRVTGGAFNTPVPAEFIPEGYACTERVSPEDGYYHVYKLEA